jgi:DNA-binding NarL/FixJ family response regulator
MASPEALDDCLSLMVDGDQTMISEAIRVLLVDDHSVVRAGLKSVLSATPDITIVGEANNGREAIAAALQLKPDVVVMDLSMPDIDGITATKEIVANEHTRVLILSMHAEEDYLVPAMEAGASGYLVKTQADRELVNAIRSIAHGEVYVQSSAARILAKKLSAKPPAANEKERYDKLTGRERDVLRRVALGFSAPEIGEQLHISPKTVDTYKQRISEKVDLSHRSQYVQFALKLGLLAVE